MFISFLLLWQNNWQNQLKKRKDLFWLPLWEDSVHSQLAPLLLGLCKVKASWRNDMGEESCLPHGSQEVEIQAGNGEQDRKGLRASCTLQRHAPSDLTSSSSTSPLNSPFCYDFIMIQSPLKTAVWQAFDTRVCEQRFISKSQHENFKVILKLTLENVAQLRHSKSSQHLHVVPREIFFLLFICAYNVSVIPPPCPYPLPYPPAPPSLPHPLNTQQKLFCSYF
jgi:hypothetical protein